MLSRAPVSAVRSPEHGALRRGPSWLLVAYPLLALAGAWTHRQGWSLAALMLLLTVLMWPALRARQALAWLLWVGLAGGMVWLASHGLAAQVLDTVPVLVSALLSWLFGRSLRAGRQPLIARIIEAVEGESRLAQPGIARYARQLTWFWTMLLAAQAVLLGVLQALAVPGGLFARLGRAPPLALPAGWAMGYVHLGGYALLVAAFLAEYLFRRWHLRHLEHMRLHDLVMRLALRWPQLVRGGRAEP
ncbi:xanthomonadin biosynthesis protein [Frateuria sp. Soil773]|nr:xanthomonadin biosynthesis protein [Frateuria sp. Soil773]